MLILSNKNNIMIIKLSSKIKNISKNNDGQGAPDPYWIINSNMVIVFEDKMYQSNKKVPISDVREARTHYEWIKKNESSLSRNVKIITVFTDYSQGTAPSIA